MPNCIPNEFSIIRPQKKIKAYQDDESTEEGIGDMRGRYLELYVIPISAIFPFTVNTQPT